MKTIGANNNILVVFYMDINASLVRIHGALKMDLIRLCKVSLLLTNVVKMMAEFIVCSFIACFSPFRAQVLASVDILNQWKGLDEPVWFTAG